MIPIFAAQGASVATRALFLLAVAVVLIGAGVAAGIRWEKSSTMAVQAEFAEFRTATNLAGERQEKESALEATRLASLKKESDHALQTALGRVSDLAHQLRQRRADPGRSIVPAAPADTRRPDLACFDRAEFDRAQRDSEGAAEEIAISGAEDAVRLETAREWAAGLQESR